MPHQQQPETLVQSIEQLLAALEAGIETLATDHAVALSLIDGIRSDETIEAIVTKNDMATVREQLTDALIEIEAARGRARAELFHALLREGHSIGHIARMWGISRQLASRIVHESTTG
jgi:transcriptional/translational regulatory protein YebC/TACO1